MQNIYFCFPHKGVGGVAILFIRVAEYLASSGIARCYLVDYEDGYMAQNRDNNLTELVVYPKSGKVLIPSDATVIFQSMTPWSIFPNLDIHEEAKVLFWNCHPLNLIPSIPRFRTLTSGNLFVGQIILHTVLISFTFRVKKFISYLLQKKALLFMDGNNVSITANYLRIKIKNPQLLPIPAQRTSIRKWSKNNLSDPKVFKFLWVGRIVDFKYYPLKRFLQDLSNIDLGPNFKPELIVVGCGESLGALRNDASLQTAVSVTFIDHIENHNLDSFILDNACILIGMGTSALEGAKLGVPTLLLDFSYSKISGVYKYGWVHQTASYNLGEMIVGQNNIMRLGNSLKEKVNEFQKHHEHISRLEAEYFDNNHDLGTVSRRLVASINDSNCRYGDLQKKQLLSRYPIYSSFRFLRGIMQNKKQN